VNDSGSYNWLREMSGKFAGQEKWYIFLTLSPERRAEHQSAQMSKITK